MKYIVTFGSNQVPSEGLLQSDLMGMHGGPQHPIHVEPVVEDLLDHGVTRLQLLSFLRGDDSTVWNGSPTNGQWVRYRAHNVSRLTTPDGLTATLTYEDHNVTAAHHIDLPDADIVGALRDIDTIIDAAIAHHGPDGVA